jgi:hypothetical protein
MKKFVLVAIGGTGMRVAQSLVALAASGFLSDLCGTETDYLLEIRLVDLDIVAGSDKIELEEMIRAVNDAIPHLSIIVDEDTADTRWKAKGVDAWQSLHPPIDDRSTLNDLVREGYLDETESLAFHALFAEDDRSMVLRRGCKGRPRIGSLLWAEHFDLDWKSKSGFWQSIFGDISPEDELRVMFAGSVFGGTGASGTPTLAQKFIRACREGKTGNTASFARHVALTLMLPYFDVGQDTDVDSGLFSINSKMALKYYETSEILSEVEFAQFVGDDRRQMEKKDEQGVWKRVRLDRNSRVDEGQNDPSMPAELMAAIGVCRYFANDIPKADNVQRKVYVPLKWSSANSERNVPAEEAVLLDSFDYFPVSNGGADAGRVRSVIDYILRLERFCLMLGTYYRSSAAMNLSWSFRPEIFRTVWRKKKDLNEAYESHIDGVGAPLAFAESMFRWLEELDHHGMQTLLKIEGDAQRNTPHIQQVFERAAREGSTSPDVLDIPCAQIATQMNSARVDPEGATKYFVSSLMECCVLRKQ